MHKEALKAAASEETRLIRHLGTKVDAEKLDWRPSESQRSTIELLRYLSSCAIGPAAALVQGDWKVARARAERTESLTLAGFDQAMLDQEAEFLALVDATSEADFAEREVSLPWGTKCTLGDAFYLMPIRFMTAYRMQLFLYAKQSGASELKTLNNWGGMDKPPA